MRKALCQSINRELFLYGVLGLDIARGAVPMINVFLLVIDHEEEAFFYSEGEFADQYYGECRKVEKYKFFSIDTLMEFLKEQQNEYGEYRKVKVTSY